MKKLSEMNTNEMMDVLAIVTPEFGEIMSDSEITGAFNQKKNKGENKAAYGIKRIVGLTPLLVQNHKEAVYRILSAFNGKTVEEIGAQNGILTAKELYDLFSDKDLMSFFGSSPTSEQKE